MSYLTLILILVFLMISSFCVFYILEYYIIKTYKKNEKLIKNIEKLEKNDKL